MQEAYRPGRTNTDVEGFVGTDQRTFPSISKKSRLALAIAAPVLALSAACKNEDKNNVPVTTQIPTPVATEETQQQLTPVSTEESSQQPPRELAPELIEACDAIVSSNFIGDNESITGAELALDYALEHRDNPEAMYIAATGVMFAGEIELGVFGLEQVTQAEDVTPERQELAQIVIDSYRRYQENQEDSTLLVFFVAMEAVRAELKTSCSSDSITSNDTGVEDTSSKENEMRNLIECAIEGNASCENELLINYENSLPVLQKEILRNDVEHEYIPGAFIPRQNVLDLTRDILVRMNKNFDYEVNETVGNVVSVLECLSHSPCSEIEIDGESFEIEATDINSITGRNSIAFLQSVANYYPPPSGVDIVTPHVERIQAVQQWLDENRTDSNNYGLLSLRLIGVTSYVDEINSILED